MADETAAAPDGGIDLNDPASWERASPLDLAHAALTTPPATPAPETPQAAPVGPAPATPDGVLTRDGQHVIPFEELATTRARLAEEKARREELEARIAALETSAPAAPAGAVLQETPVASAVPDWSGRAELLARIEAAQGVDDEIADALRAGLEARDSAAAAQAHAAAMEARLAALESGTQTLLRREAVTEEAEMQAAFAAQPLLVQLHAQKEAGNPGLFNAAVTLRQGWANDPAYLALNWADRLAYDAAQIAKQFGLNPAGTTPPAATPTHRPPVPTAPAVPLSLSHIPGGQVQEPAPRSLADIEGLPPQQQVEFLARMADANFEQFTDTISQLPWGSLNTPGSRPGV